MRNLTITRNKTFVGCLMKMKFYIEDPNTGDTTIGGTLCRRLGDLKNGETKTFSVDENEAKVYVIADQLSKGFCNEFAVIPAGSEDVVLTGQNRFNPATGNAFQFDGQASEAVTKNRSKNLKRGILILVATAIVCVGIAVLSAFLDKAEPKTFTNTLGFSITLTDAFEETEVEGYDAGYESYDVLLSIFKESVSDFEELGYANMTVQDYAQVILDVNDFGDGEIKSENGLIYYEFEEKSADGTENLYYYVTFYKSEESFWMFEFLCFEDEKDEWRSEFEEWAKSVTFAK